MLSCPALMETGGISARLVDLARALIGHLRGGIGMAVVVAMWVRQEERSTARLDARLAAERAARGEEEPAWPSPR